MQRRTPLSRLFKILCGLIALCVVWLVVAFFEYRHERGIAKAAINTVGELQVGYSTQGQAEVMLTPYAKFRVKGLEKGIQLAFVNRRWLEPLSPAHVRAGRGGLLRKPPSGVAAVSRVGP